MKPGQIADNLRSLRKWWSDHYVGTITSAAIAVALMTWAVYPLYLDLVGKTVVEKVFVQTAATNERAFNDLKSEVVDLRKSLAERNAIIDSLREERLALQKRLADALQKREVVELDAKAVANQTARELHAKLEDERKVATALRNDFPSLRSRGLWDNGRPSPSALAEAGRLAPPLRESALAALEGPTVSSADKALIVELVARYTQTLDQCTPLSVGCESAKKRQSAFSERTRYITPQTDQNQFEREAADLKSRTTEACNIASSCLSSAASLQTQLLVALSRGGSRN